MSSEQSTSIEYRVTWRSKHGWGPCEMIFANEADARHEAGGLRADNVANVRVWKREISPWQVFAQSEETRS